VFSVFEYLGLFNFFFSILDIVCRRRRKKRIFLLLFLKVNKLVDRPDADVKVSDSFHEKNEFILVKWLRKVKNFLNIFLQKLFQTYQLDLALLQQIYVLNHFSTRPLQFQKLVFKNLLRHSQASNLFIDSSFFKFFLVNKVFFINYL
jgi:hypothetical protein